MTFPAHATSSVVGFAAGLADHGDRIALATSDELVTYEELARRADVVADRLGAGRRLVLLHGANALEVVAGYLGALRGGHVPLLVPGNGQVDLHRLQATFDPDVIVAQDAEGNLTVTDAARRIGPRTAPGPRAAC